MSINEKKNTFRFAKAQIFLTQRKDTVSSTVNQIPTALVKAKPVVSVQQVQVQVPMAMTVPVVGHQVNVQKQNPQYDMNKLFNEMKNSKKPFMRITMKGPPKPTSLFPDPFSLFDDNRYLCVCSRSMHTHSSTYTPKQCNAMQIRMQKQINCKNQSKIVDSALQSKVKQSIAKQSTEIKEC